MSIVSNNSIAKRISVLNIMTGSESWWGNKWAKTEKIAAAYEAAFAKDYGVLTEEELQEILKRSMWLFALKYENSQREKVVAARKMFVISNSFFNDNEQ